MLLILKKQLNYTLFNRFTRDPPDTNLKSWGLEIYVANILITTNDQVSVNLLLTQIFTKNTVKKSYN